MNTNTITTQTTITNNGILSADLQAKAQTAAAAARYRERLAKRKARKARKATSPQHKAAMARRAESAGDATRHYAEHDDLMTTAIINRQ